MFKQEAIHMAVAGHVDHGKSTLIGRLLLDTNSLPRDKIAEVRKISKDLGQDSALAYVADQLKEEREGHLTMDTTQALLKTPRRNFVLIDTPGHLEFIKNMLSGASHADCAILVVDAKEGIQEQTRRHAYLLGMLGIKNVIAAVNKMDLVGYSRETFVRIENTLKEIMKNLGISVLQTIPISATEGMNIQKRPAQLDWYRLPPLLNSLEKFPSKKDYTKLPLRLPVQDIYRIGKENLIVGKVASGTIRQGEEVLIFPSRERARVHSIKIWNGRKTKASCGENIGVMLKPEIPASRGQVLCRREDPPRLLSDIRANVFWISEKELTVNGRFDLRCSTQNAKARVQSITRRINPSTLHSIEENSQSLSANEAATVNFLLDKPLAVENFDFLEELGSFVIEDSSEPLGIGIIPTNTQK